MQNKFENLTIGVFAREAGVNIETIRFYQRKGLLPEPNKPHGGIRRYGETDVTRVRFVKSAQRLGFSLDEIAELMRLEDGTHCEEASSLAEHKLKDVHEKQADLALMEAALSGLVRACHASKGKVSCPLIESLNGERAPQPAGAAGSMMARTRLTLNVDFHPFLAISDCYGESKPRGSFVQLPDTDVLHRATRDWRD